MAGGTDDVRSRAGEFIDDPALLGDPLPVRGSDGVLASWFVPVVDDARVTGFVELMPDLSHRRTSRFAEAPGAASWLDARTVGRRAAGSLRPGETAHEPYLSYDGVLDRLAWAVPVSGPGGTRLLFVAGDAVWEGSAPAGGAVGDAR